MIQALPLTALGRIRRVSLAGFPFPRPYEVLRTFHAHTRMERSRAPPSTAQMDPWRTQRAVSGGIGKIEISGWTRCLVECRLFALCLS